jgi:hypothetical protein
MQDIVVKQESNQLIFNMAGQDVSLTPHSDNKFSSEAFPLVEFQKNSEGRPMTIKLVRPYGEITILDYDSGPADDTGPNRQEWQKHMALYSFDFHKFRMYSTPVIRNGHLFLLSTMNSKEYFLNEWKEDIFFTADGLNVAFSDVGFEMPASKWVRDDISVERIKKIARSNPNDIRVNKVSLAEYEEILRRTGLENEAAAVEKLKKDLYPSAMEENIE